MLPAREQIAQAVPTRGQRWKHLEYLIDLPGLCCPAAISRGRQQVFRDRKIRKHLAPFRHQPDPGLGHPVTGLTAHVLTVDADAAGTWRQQSHDAVDGSGLAHAVAPHQGHHLAGAYFQIDPE